MDETSPIVREEWAAEARLIAGRSNAEDARELVALADWLDGPPAEVAGLLARVAELEAAKGPGSATRKIRDELLARRQAPDFDGCLSVIIHVDRATIRQFLKETAG